MGNTEFVLRLVDAAYIAALLPPLHQPKHLLTLIQAHYIIFQHAFTNHYPPHCP